MPTPPPDTQRTRARVEKLARLLDDAIRIPGTSVRIGLDSVLGLLPGVGDVLGLVLGVGILYETVRIGAPRSLVVKMLLNSALDAIGGLVPVAGDLFDFAFKSHARNAKLLTAHLDRLEAAAGPAAPASPGVGLAMVGAFLLTALALMGWAWSRLLG